MEVILSGEEVILKEAQHKTSLLLADLDIESSKAKIKKDEVELTTRNC